MTFDPGVKVIEEGVVDHAQHRAFLVYQPERDGDEGEPMDKIRCSWVHVRTAAASTMGDDHRRWGRHKTLARLSSPVESPRSKILPRYYHDVSYGGTRCGGMYAQLKARIRYLDLLHD